MTSKGFIPVYLARYNEPVSSSQTSVSPWRELFEAVRGALRGRRDAQGTVGSINWLRAEMAVRGANPNVVRNIIYRDKGKVTDKRVLFAILSELWEGTGGAPLELPELGLLLGGPTGPGGELAQLLGRDKRGVYGTFVGAVRSSTLASNTLSPGTLSPGTLSPGTLSPGTLSPSILPPSTLPSNTSSPSTLPKLLVTGRPGSGKTLLTDLVQGALEEGGRPLRVVRQEFAAGGLAAALQSLALVLGVPPGVLEAKLVRVGAASAYAVQADAQADVARTILEHLRTGGEPTGPLVLLLHVSQSAGTADTLGDAPLRLSTPDVPRVGLTEWLWHNLLEPLARAPQVALLVSLAELPHALAGRTGAFGGPVKLSPPTVAEARRFVRALAPGLPAERQDELVARARRSFEDLRTLTLLAEAREPLGEERGGEGRGAEQLGRLAWESTNARLRDFLGTLAVLALPEFPAVSLRDLEALREADPPELTGLELAFLDAVPGDGPPGEGPREAPREGPREGALYRPFSRRFARALRQGLREADPARFRAQSLAASRLFAAGAHEDPRSDAAGRYVRHLYAARAWADLVRWAEHAPLPQSLLTRIWETAQRELTDDPDTLRAVALRVASTYVRLGSTEHPDAAGALAALAAGGDARLRAWTLAKRAESAVLGDRLDEAEGLLADLPDGGDVEGALEADLLRAYLERRRSGPGGAAERVREGLAALGGLAGVRDPALKFRLGLWDCLVARDGGDLEGALEHLRALETGDDLARARLRFAEAAVLGRLGRLGEAQTALGEAVRQGHAGEAPASERARTLARRGGVQRRRGALLTAGADFAAAYAVLAGADERAPLRLAFERAKVQGEEATLLAATGRPDEAVAALQTVLETYAAYGEHYDVDLSFRALRTRLRLAEAYGARAFSTPPALPPTVYPDLPDLHCARRLVGEVLGTLGRDPERYAGLVFRARLCAGRLLVPDRAIAEATLALEAARYPYPRAEARAALAGALLRGGDPGAALAALEVAEAEFAASGSDDYRLEARLGLLTAGALLETGRLEAAHGRVKGALEQPELGPYHDALLYRFGEAAEHAGLPVSPAALGRGPEPLPSTLRPADALVLRFRERAEGPNAPKPTEPLEKAG